MAELTNDQIDAALEHCRLAHTTQPRAASALYDTQRGRVIVELTNGSSFAFPSRLAQRLELARDDQLSKIEILGAGCGLLWEARC
jgi:hypothetical protein